MGSFLFIAGVVLYVVWLVTPRVRHPELVEEILTPARARFEVWDRYLEDRELNGYWDAEEVMNGWAEQKEENSPESPAARKVLEELAPQLSEALKKPYFLVPSSMPTMKDDLREWRPTTMVSLRSLGCGLANLGRSQIEAGKIWRGIHTLCLSLRFSLEIRNQTDLVTRNLADALSTMSIRSIAELIPTGHESLEDWERLSSLCLPARTLREELVNGFGDHLLEGLVGLQSMTGAGLRRGLTKGEGLKIHSFQLLLLLSFRVLAISQRDSRAICNSMAELVQQVRKGRPLAPPMSRLNLFAAIFIPSEQYLENLVSAIHDSQGSLLGLGVSAKLLAFRLRHGAFPATLEDLNLGQDLEDFHWDSAEAKLRIKSLPNLPGGNRPPNEHGWMKRDSAGWLFQLSPPC